MVVNPREYDAFTHAVNIAGQRIGIHIWQMSIFIRLLNLLVLMWGDTA